MTTQAVPMPQHLDDLPTFLGIIPIDQLCALLIPVMLGVFVGSILCGLALGIICLMGWRRYQQQSQQTLSALIYWHFSLGLPINAFARRILG